MRLAILSRVCARTVVAATAAVVALAPSHAAAATHFLTAHPNGRQAIPSNSSTATGGCGASIDDVTGHLTFSGTYKQLRAVASAARIRAPEGVIASASSVTLSESGTFSGSATVTPQAVAEMLSGQTDCEIDDAAFPSGEIAGPLALPGLPQAPAMPPLFRGALLLILLSAGMLVLRSRKGGIRVS
jgi:hypothetical protein